MAAYLNYSPQNYVFSYGHFESVVEVHEKAHDFWYLKHYPRKKKKKKTVWKVGDCKFRL